MATNPTATLKLGSTSYDLKDNSGTKSTHTHTKDQITDFPSSMTPSSHTHGNIQNGGTLQTNDITIASGDKLVVTDSSDSSKVARTSVSFDGSTATKCLTQKGTWETFGTSNLTIGTSGTTACAGNDSRLSDARTPSNNSDLVHISGTETITGTKTFSSAPKTTGFYVDWLQLKTSNANDYCIQFDSSITMGLGHDIHFLNTDGNISMYVTPFSSSTAYAVGQYTVYQGQLYKCTTAHSASAWNSSHFTRCVNKIVSVDDIIGKTFEATGSDYAEKFETLEDCPACRFVTLDGEKIKLAQPEDDYILGITSELPSIIGDKMNQGTPVGLLGKLWVECDDTVKVNGFVTSGKDGIATKSDKGYRVMAVDGNKCKVLVK